MKDIYISKQNENKTGKITITCPIPEDEVRKIYRENISLQSQGKFTEALLRLEYLAAYNHGASQFDLGWMYFNGRGVRQDKRKAYHWWIKSKQNGFKDACLLMRTLKLHQKFK